MQVQDLPIHELIDRAFAQLPRAYAPYSHFHVGAALLGADGEIYAGCNVENAAYGPSNCAERTAFFHAVSQGQRDFCAICIVGGSQGMVEDYCPPCGVCRQVMMEFCDPDTFQIILAKSKEDYCIVTLRELLPMGFGPGNLDDDVIAIAVERMSSYDPSALISEDEMNRRLGITEADLETVGEVEFE